MILRLQTPGPAWWALSGELRFGSWTARSSASCVWGLTPPHGRCSLWLDKGISGLTDWNLQYRAAIPMISLFPWVLCYMLLTQCRNIGLGNNRVMPSTSAKFGPVTFPSPWLGIQCLQPLLIPPSAFPDGNFRERWLRVSGQGDTPFVTPQSAFSQDWRIRVCTACAPERKQKLKFV